MKKLILLPLLLAMTSCSSVKNEAQGAASAATFGVGILTYPIVAPFLGSDSDEKKEDE